VPKITLALLLILTLTASAAAQLEGGSTYLLLSGGYAGAKIKATDSRADGGAIGLAVEGHSWAKPVSFFVSAYYTEMQKGATEEDTGVQYSVSAIPISLGAKGRLGYGKFQGYFGGGLVVYFSNVQRTVGTSTTTLNSSNGWGMTVPLGLTYTFGGKFFINLDYTFYWLLDTEAFESSLLNVASLGFGFRISD
jgi:hypothetical protein